MRSRTRLSAALAGLAALSVPLLLPSSANAVAGPPPEPTTKTVLSKVHTDAMSTSLEKGTLKLGTKADLPGTDSTPLDPALTIFHVDDAAKTVIPPGFEFIGDAGSEAWIAPEANPSTGSGYSTLWPGFSTESVPAGAILNDKTTFTLEDFDGPGELELFTGVSLGTPNRLWSSDEGLQSFDMARAHKHANWAFTAEGDYTLTVRADVALPAGNTSATADYTFVVGDVPAAAPTTTALSVSPGSVAVGATVSLAASVSPTSATGWVEFFDGEKSLGHSVVEAGRASLEVNSLPLGNRSISARFTPEVTNDFSSSSSPARSVAVVQQQGGELFGISGVASSYQAGELIDLRATGITLGEGERLWWLIQDRDGGTEFAMNDANGTIFGDRLTRDATTALDGATIRVAVIDSSYETVQESAPYTLHVSGKNVGSGMPVLVSGLATEYYVGDRVDISVDHAALADGQTYRWVVRYLPYSVGWDELWAEDQPTGSNPFTFDTRVLAYGEVALQIVDAAGEVVGQSAAISPTLVERELQLSGARSVYRVGETVQVSSDLFPSRDGVSYQWGIAHGWEEEDIPGATGPSIDLPVTADFDGAELYLRATDSVTGHLISKPSVTLRVTDAAAGEQLVLLNALSAHYHQGGTIALSASADPVASSTDTYRWLWQRPDQHDFHAIENATAATHTVRAQQALDGTVVKAQLLSAAGDVLATSETVTIHVDDHGAAAQEKASISGVREAYVAGDVATLEAAVAPASVLTRWEWYLRGPADDNPRIIDGENGPSISLATKEDMNGAEVFARLTFDDGTPYVESPPVRLIVRAGDSDAPAPVTPAPELPSPAIPAPGTSPEQEAPAGTAPAATTPGLSEPAASRATPSETLPSTGADTLLGTVAAALLLPLGFVLLLVGRRRMRTLID